MTIENLLLSVCEAMTPELTDEQLTSLKDILFMKFRGIEIREECTAVQTAIGAEEERLLDFFRASKMISGRAKSTMDQYLREIRILRDECGKPLTEITSTDLRWYFGMCRAKRGNSMSTVLSKRRYLSSFYDFLYREGIVPQNPLEKLEVMKVEKKIREAFCTEDLEKLRVTCGRDFRARALVEFLLSTGVRVSECCALNVGDIDLYRQEFLVTGKGNKQRRCYINDTGCFYLLRYLTWRMDKEHISREDLLGKPLFASSRAPYKRMTKRGIEKMLTALGNEAGVQNVHPHRFRRTYASTMASRGCPLQDLKTLMGHSKIDTTMIYCDVKEENVSMSYRRYGEIA